MGKTQTRNAECGCTWWRDHADNRAAQEFHALMRSSEGGIEAGSLGQALTIYGEFLDPTERSGFLIFVAEHNWDDPVGMTTLAEALDSIFGSLDDADRVLDAAMNAGSAA